MQRTKERRVWDVAWFACMTVRPDYIRAWRTAYIPRLFGKSVAFCFVIIKRSIICSSDTHTMNDTSRPLERHNNGFGGHCQAEDGLHSDAEVDYGLIWCSARHQFSWTTEYGSIPRLDSNLIECHKSLKTRLTCKTLRFATSGIFSCLDIPTLY